MKKTIIGAALAACMLLCGFAATGPATNLQANAATFELFVNGEDVLIAENNTVTCGDGTAYYDADSLTLTLDNATITGDHLSSGVYVSGAPAAFTVKIKGENLIDFSAENSGYYAVRCWDKHLFTVKGDDPENDSLKTVIYAKQGTTQSPFGILSQGDITIENVSLDFSLADGSRSNGFAIYPNGAKPCNLSIKNSTVIVSDYMQGISAFSGDVNIENSTVNIDAEEIAIYTDYNLTISGGKVTVSSTDEYESPAICTWGAFNVKNNASVKATALASAIGVSKLNVENGKITAIGGDYYYPVYVREFDYSSEDQMPEDQSDLIVLGENIAETNGATVVYEDWEYIDDEYDPFWRRSAHFEPYSSVVNIEKVLTVTYTDGYNGEMFADQVYRAGENMPTPEFQGDYYYVNGMVFKGWNKTIAETVTESVTYTAVWKDVLAPFGKITIGGKSWTTKVSGVNFGTYFGGAREVNITAADNGGGNVKIEYYISNEKIEDDELALAAFKPYYGKFTLEGDGKYVVYVKLTDNSGNVGYINSNGVVIDTITPVISGIESGKTYCIGKKASVTDENGVTVTADGKTLSVDKNGNFELSPADGEQTIIATDKAGNSFKITVTVNKTHTGGKATCTKAAVCEICGESYGEPDANGHSSLKHFDEKAATAENEGNKEYWHCDECGNYYSDSAATQKTDAESVKIEKLPAKNGGLTALWIAIAVIVCGGIATGVTFFIKHKKA